MTKPGYIENKNSSIDKTGDWAKNQPILNSSKCAKCYTCWLSCPEGAIKISESKTPVFNYNICKGCGICSKICPKNAIEMREKDE